MWSEYDDGHNRVDPAQLEEMLKRCGLALAPAAVLGRLRQQQQRACPSALCSTPAEVPVAALPTACRLPPPLGLGLHATNTDVLRFVFRSVPPASPQGRPLGCEGPAC